MSAPVRFLHSLAQSIATISLYGPGHPARTSAVDTTYKLLDGLHYGDRQPVFTFLGENVVHDRTVLPALRGWQWATRLSEAGVQRMEFAPDLSRDSFEHFLDRLLNKLGSVAAAADAMDEADAALDGVRFGAIVASDETDSEDDGFDDSSVPAYSLAEETAVTRWIFANAERRGVVPASEAELVVRSLSVLRHAEVRPSIPILQLPSFDDYLVMHSINVASLSLALAERLGAARREALRVGVAGLLHDIGMAGVPRELMEKSRLTREERDRIRRHPADGARMLMAGAPSLEAAAVAAYEHHMRPDGSGYPVLATVRRPHVVSAIVKVASVFTALRSSRLHWPAWSLARSLRYMESGMGVEFEAEVAATFVRMLRGGRDRQVAVTEHGDDVPNLALLEDGEEAATADRGTLG
ncbi:MAG TPA: HD domain-containing phosphohydrolase [Gemmatimonadales bacterium]|nr:HD domain-containing phosphohydrolase [Gemmatimonadales bacterium]